MDQRGRKVMPSGLGNITPDDLILARYIAIACGLLVLFYGIVVAVFSRVGFPAAMSTGDYMPFLSDKPVGEDGFYMLLISWNLASGNGFTANFGETTTGVQPLSVFLFAMTAKLVMLLHGNKFDFVRAVIVIGSINVVCFGYIIGKITTMMIDDKAKSEIAFYFSFSIVCLSFYFFRTFTYGLETGFYLLSISATIYIVLCVENFGKSLLSSFIVGVMMGVTGLFRIDFGVVVAVFLFCILIRGRKNKLCLFVSGLTALVIVAPWFIWVHIVSGSWLPSSGPAQSSIISRDDALARLSAMSEAVTQNVSAWLFTGSQVGPLVISIVGVFCLLSYSLVARSESDFINVERVKVFSCWAIAITLLFPIYMIAFWAAHFYSRYTAPFSIVSTVFFSVIFARVMTKRSFLVVISIAFLSNVIFSYFSLHTGKVGNTHSVTAGYVQTELPHSEKIGAFQSGVVGYFNLNVVNLDGKINQAALRALKENKLQEYLTEAKIDYVVDWGDVQSGTMSGFPPSQWINCPKAVPNNASVCLMRAHSAIRQ